MQQTIQNSIQRRRPSRGFSLIQVSLLIAVASVMMVSILPGGQLGSESEKRAVTMQRMQKIHDKLRTYMITNQRLPCPVRMTWSFSSFLFGKDQNTPGSCTVNVLYNPPFSDSTTAAGLVPVRSLGLPDDYAIDGYGRRFMYMVDKEATAVGTCHRMMLNNESGKIRILNSASTSTVTKDRTMWALMSYGQDGHGAYSLQGNATRLNTGTTFADTMYNAFASDASLSTSYHGTLVQHAPTGSGIDRFDDIVWYNEHDKHNCCLGYCLGGGMGLRISGDNTNQLMGSALASGDVNADGISDLIIGAPNANGGVGAIYVVFGTKSGLPTDLSRMSLDGTNGFRLDGATALAYAGWSVASGDINGDGRDDVIIGAPYANGARGYTYVVFGKSSGWASATSLDTGAGNLIDGSQGFRIDGTSANDLAGNSVSSGDINGDGIGDLIISAINAASQRGYTYVVFGKATGWAATNLLDAGAGKLIDGTQGFRLDGITAGDGAGYTSAAGDINADGLEDVLIGAPGANGNRGYVYVVFGKATGWAATNLLDAGAGKLIDGTQGFRLDGISGYDGLGQSIASGDMNGDGLKDLISGAPSANTYSGYTYVVFGKTSGWSATASVSTGSGNLIDGTKGFRLDGTIGYAFAGNSVAAGDVNGDGIADLVTSAPSVFSNTGYTYVVFGKKTTWAATSLLNTGAGTLIDGTQGLRLDGANMLDFSGSALRTIDLNGDYISDIVTGASHANDYDGYTYVVYGRSGSWSVPFSLGDL